MGHFCVFVITENTPSDAELDEILSPWDGSDYNDHAHKLVDKHDELLEEWETGTVRGYRLPDGTEYSAFDPIFKKVTMNNAPKPGSFHAWLVKKIPILDPTTTSTTYIVPDKYEDIQIPFKTVFASPEAFAREFHGYTDIKNGRYGITCNPDSKWDWWQIGGNYSNLFSDRDPEDNPKNWETCFLCKGTGVRKDAFGQQARQINPDANCNGCNGKGQSLKNASAWVDEGNQTRIGDLAHLKKKPKAVAARLEKIKRAEEVSKLSRLEMERALRLILVFEETAAAMGDERPSDKERNTWLREQGTNGVTAVAVIEAFSNYPPQLKQEETLDDWAQAALPFSTAALILKGIWYERGFDLWLSNAPEEINDTLWDREFERLIASLPTDHWITVVDCHC